MLRGRFAQIACDHGEIIVAFPEKFEADEIDDVLAQIDILKRQMRRSVVPAASIAAARPAVREAGDAREV